MQVSEAACQDVWVEFSKGENGNDATVAIFHRQGKSLLPRRVRGSRNSGTVLLCALTAMQVQTPWEGYWGEHFPLQGLDQNENVCAPERWTMRFLRQEFSSPLKSKAKQFLGQKAVTVFLFFSI